jgi:hypothetical protein
MAQIGLGGPGRRDPHPYGAGRGAMMGAVAGRSRGIPAHMLQILARRFRPPQPRIQLFPMQPGGGDVGGALGATGDTNNIYPGGPMLGPNGPMGHDINQIRARLAALLSPHPAVKNNPAIGMLRQSAQSGLQMDMQPMNPAIGAGLMGGAAGMQQNTMRRNAFQRNMGGARKQALNSLFG